MPIVTSLPTRPQRRVLLALAANPHAHVSYKFDLGGVSLEGPGVSVSCLPSIRTIDACHDRGWLTYTVHKWGEGEVQIERRYVLTEGGKRALELC